MENSVITPIGLQLEARAIELAYRLGSLEPFLEAARELLTCDKLPSSEFKRHGRKIIALIEIARSTLQGVGLELYSFTHCSHALSPYKAIYFELLRVLAGHRYNIDADLQGRTSSLLLPLSTRFVVQRTGDPPFYLTGHAVGAEPRAPLHIGGALEHNASGSTTNCRDTSSSVMPPPDAFSLITHDQKRSRQLPSNPARRLWSLDRARPHCRKLALSATADQENTTPSSLPFHPRPRRFGIFYTGKTSPHRLRERVGRSMSVRPIGKE